MLRTLQRLMERFVDSPYADAIFERLETMTGGDTWYWKGPHDFCLNASTPEKDRIACMEKYEKHLETCRKCARANT